MCVKIGIIGIGIMGSAIARNLMAAGFDVTGFDVAKSACDALAAMGGTVARSAAAAADGAEIVLTSLPSVGALDETAAALAAKPHPKLVLAELSTLPIEAKLRCRDTLGKSHIAMLDCPLSGTGAQAVTRDLAVYASGERDAYDRAAPVFAAFARAPHYVGEFGNGSKLKFIANLLVAIHNVASAEAMVLGIKAGLDPADVIALIKSGVGNSRIFELRAPMMAKGEYQPATMKIDIWQKDMAVIGEFAKSLGVATPLFAATVPVYNAAIGLGHGADDTAAVCAVLEKMAGVERS
jgi:L-threonate 2-dehydrogenase